MPQAKSPSQATTKVQQTISSFFTRPPSSHAPHNSKASPADAKARGFLDNPNLVDSTESDTTPTLSAKNTPTFQCTEGPPQKRQRLITQRDDPAHVTSTIPEALQEIDNGVEYSSTILRPCQYAFAGTKSVDQRDCIGGDNTGSQGNKDELHEKFARKLGSCDSLPFTKGRNWVSSDPTTLEQTNNAEDDEDEEAAAELVEERTSKRAKSGKSSKKLTPMEQQYLDIKRNHLDAVLLMEVGYKYRFLGDDARIAARELSIVCIPGKMRYDEHPSEAHLDRFASASFPVHRLHVHVRRLVGAGLKVGVIRQIETAALKAAGDNRNTPFVRKLTNMYTQATYMDEPDDNGEVNGSSYSAINSNYLVCITEENAKGGGGTDEKVHVSIVAVQLATGDIIYDDFEDGFMRCEIETRLLHIAPSEILIVGELTKASDKLIGHISSNKSNAFSRSIRVERVGREKTAAAMACSHISNFYTDRVASQAPRMDEGQSNKTLDNVLALPGDVIICLSAMVRHLEEYGLQQIFDLTKYFQPFSARSHMLLNGTTLSSLEIYHNQSEHSEKGSLFWTMDRTKTRFGRRLLRKWVGRPLLVKAELDERMAAVEELKVDYDRLEVARITRFLTQTKIDLEKGLVRIYYGKCLRSELVLVLQALQKAGQQFPSNPSGLPFTSALLNRTVAVLSTVTEHVVAFLELINLRAAQTNDKYAFFREEAENDTILAHKMGIMAVEQDLEAYRSVAAEKIGKKKVDYITISGTEYLIEVDNSTISRVPASWIKVSGTKKLSRFHTPEVVNFIREREQHKEALDAACDKAFLELLERISSKYQIFRDCVHAIATLDCLSSLAIIANQPGYAKPKYLSSTGIKVRQGRHPMVEQLLHDAYVPNDIELSSDKSRGLFITGPNMGGKSSYVRQVALIIIMAQIGSYVPAASAELGMFDAVLTRMGAFDNIMAGESTFMVELSETADILKQATSKSLVILDELGRGTSTHDGVAIAQAVLDYVLREKKSLVLFITHYQSLRTMEQTFENQELRNVHMRFNETATIDDELGEITFLYEVGQGVAHRSYGLNVAKLANIPNSIISLAGKKSSEMEANGRAKSLRYLGQALESITNSNPVGGEDFMQSLAQRIEEL